MASRVRLSARECLPRDAREALLVGRAWVPAEDGPSVIGVRGDDAVDLTRSYPTVSQLLNAAKPADVRAAILSAPAARAARGDRRQQRRGPSRSLAAVAPRARRSAGGQGQRRDLRREPARARHRGAGARQSRPGRGRAARDPGHHRARSAGPPARLPGGGARQGGARRQGHVVAVPRGRHRAGRGAVHQVPAHGRRGPRRARGHPSGLGLEQPRARAGAGRSTARARSSPSPSATT